MIAFIKSNLPTLLGDLHLPEWLVFTMSFSILTVLISAAAWLGNFIAQRYLVRLLRLIADKAHREWSEIASENQLIFRIGRLVPGLLVHLSAPLYNVETLGFTASLAMVIQNAARIYLVVMVGLIIDAALHTGEMIYSRYPISIRRPIKAYLQVIRIILFSMISITVLATLMDTSPWTFITGLGAATAVLLVIFRDSILGFVASIQIASYDMIRLGDWIEMPNFGADGDVVELSLTTVKVRNFDRSITTIPTASLLNTGVRNWRPMVESGGRRIKRAINVDQTGIRFLTESDLQRLQNIEMIRDFIAEKRAEISAAQGTYEKDPEFPVNGRRMTNIGLYQAYIRHYLVSNPEIHNPGSGFTFIIRQLKPGELGLPIEVYVFTTKVDWASHERIQADVFDHLLSALPIFGLQAFQGFYLSKNPSK